MLLWRQDVKYSRICHIWFLYYRTIFLVLNVLKEFNEYKIVIEGHTRIIFKSWNLLSKGVLIRHVWLLLAKGRTINDHGGLGQRIHNECFSSANRLVFFFPPCNGCNFFFSILPEPPPELLMVRLYSLCTCIRWKLFLNILSYTHYHNSIKRFMLRNPLSITFISCTKWPPGDLLWYSGSQS